MANAESGGDSLVITQTQTGLGEIQPPVEEEGKGSGSEGAEGAAAEFGNPTEEEELGGHKGDGEGGVVYGAAGEAAGEEQVVGGEGEGEGAGDKGGFLHSQDEGGAAVLMGGIDKVKANRRRQELNQPPHIGGAEAADVDAAAEAVADGAGDFGQPGCFGSLGGPLVVRNVGCALLGYGGWRRRLGTAALSWL